MNVELKFSYTLCFCDGKEFRFVVGFGQNPGHFILGQKPGPVRYEKASEAAAILERIEEFFPLSGSGRCFIVLPIPEHTKAF